MANGHCLLVSLALSLWGASAKTALLVVDVQTCFLPGGTLEVPAEHIVPKIVQLRDEGGCFWDEVVYTRDFHPAGHISFASTHGLAPFSGEIPIVCTKPVSGLTKDSFCCPKAYTGQVDCNTSLCSPESFKYTADSGIIKDNEACTECAADPSSCFDTVQAMWTDHCLQDGDSTFPSELKVPEDAHVVKKGMNKFVDAYSGFMDNTGTTKTELESFLKEKGIDKVYIAGIAADVCVKWTVKDALAEGFEVTVVSDATAAVQGNKANLDAALQFMKNQGALSMTTSVVLAMINSTACDISAARNVAPATFLLAVAILLTRRLHG